MTFDFLKLARYIIANMRETLTDLFFKAVAFIDVWQFRHYKSFAYILKGFICSLKQSFTV
jgi:hypothetical protein